jgi:hypothetical protein
MWTIAAGPRWHIRCLGRDPLRKVGRDGVSGVAVQAVPDVVQCSPDAHKHFNLQKIMDDVTSCGT